MTCSYLEWQQAQNRGDESFEMKDHDDLCASELAAPASNLSDEVLHELLIFKWLLKKCMLTKLYP